MTTETLTVLPFAVYAGKEHDGRQWAHVDCEPEARTVAKFDGAQAEEWAHAFAEARNLEAGAIQDPTAVRVPLNPLPWFVIVNPDWYDESEGDAGYAWSGPAASKADAIDKALSECWADNDREDDAPTYDAGAHIQDGFTIYEASPDFQALARDVARARQSGDAAKLIRALDVIDYAISQLDGGEPAPAEKDPWHVGELPGDDGRTIRDQNGLTVSVETTAIAAAEKVAAHNLGL